MRAELWNGATTDELFFSDKLMNYLRMYYKLLIMINNPKENEYRLMNYNEVKNKDGGRVGGGVLRLNHTLCTIQGVPE